MTEQTAQKADSRYSIQKEACHEGPRERLCGLIADVIAGLTDHRLELFLPDT